MTTRAEQILKLFHRQTCAAAGSILVTKHANVVLAMIKLAKFRPAEAGRCWHNNQRSGRHVPSEELHQKVVDLLAILYSLTYTEIGALLCSVQPT